MLAELYVSLAGSGLTVSLMKTVNMKFRNRTGTASWNLGLPFVCVNGFAYLKLPFIQRLNFSIAHCKEVHEGNDSYAHN